MSVETLHFWIKVAGAIWGILFVRSFAKEVRNQHPVAARPPHEMPLLLHWLKCCALYPLVCLALIALGAFF